MATREEENNVFFSTMAIASLAIATLGVAISLLTLKRSEAGVGSMEPTGYAPLGVNIPKVHYDDGKVLVQVRNPGEWHDIREFIQPDSPEVVRIVSGIWR